MTRRPNIVLIHTDQQRGDCLGIEGHPVLQTPNMDYLAASGARFRRAYSECPTCIPARHTILTGMEPQASGVVGFSTTAKIARPESTLPELLKRSGYQTVHMGRGWHQHPGHAHYGFEIRQQDSRNEHYSRIHQLPELGGLHRKGIDGAYGHPHYMTHGIGPNDMDARPWPYPEEFHETNWSFNKGIEFLNSRDKERPFLLSVGITAPHPPLVPPQVYYDRYFHGEIDEPCWGEWAEPPENGGKGAPPGHGKQLLTGARLRQTKSGYYGLINHVDDQMRIFLARLASLGLRENTYLFFLSDHGEMLGDHYFWRKALPYEGSARVPFLLSGPGIAPGQVWDCPIGFQDILPTCCEMADLPVPDHVTGKSLLPLVKGQTDEPVRPWIHGEHSPMEDQHPGMHYLTDGCQKYIWFNDGSEQLFDLETDPSEMQDLSGKDVFQADLRQWRQRLIQKLEGRPEGFSDGENLIPHRPYEVHNAFAVT